MGIKNMYQQRDNLTARGYFHLPGTLRLMLLVTVLLGLQVPDAWAQAVRITGKVTSAADNQGIPGASVVVKGTTAGTTTNAGGEFTLDAATDAVLVISYIGYTTEEVPVAGKSRIDVTLAEDIKALSEVVVIGYGAVKKSDLTGSVASVKGETLNQSLTSGVDQALIGRVAGITAIQTSGQPGSSVSIRIRGTSSINGNLEPLYVIDGVPVSGNNGNVYEMGLGPVGGGGKPTYSPLSGLNPNDIESVEVLKDASATAIYGNRGSNGVVIITTKRGKAGEAKISYEGYYGLQELPRRLDVMNLREFAAYQNSIQSETQGAVLKPEFADPSLLGEGTDWQDEIFRVAPMNSHQLTVTGGSEKNRYALTGGYFNQKGIVLGSGFDRYSFRLNLDSEIRKWIKVGNSFAVSRTDEQLQLFDQTGGVIQTALKMVPDVPARNFDGTFNSGQEGQGAMLSPLAMVSDRENYLKRTQLLGNVFADIQILPSLTFRTEFGGNVDFNSAGTWTPSYDYGPSVKSDVNTVTKQNNTYYGWTFKNYLTFNKSFNKVHNLTVMGGQEANEWGYQNLAGGSSNLPTNSIHQISLGNPATYQSGSAQGSSALSSYFGRVNYNFNEKYYTTFTYRADGSSNFGPGRKWGYFPSVALAYRISSEPFMAGIQSVVSDVKLRAGWGQTGNAGRNGYLYGAPLSLLPTNLGPGYRQDKHGNLLVTWETAEQIDLGLDAGFLNNRITLTFDLYRKLINDLLLESPMPAYMGSQGNPAISLKAPTGNFGTIENKGFEIELRSQNLVGKFQWETNLNFTRNRNTLVDLGIKDAALNGVAQWDVLVARSTNGMPLGEFYGYKVAGVFQDKEDILNSPVQYVGVSPNAEGEPNLQRTSTVWPGDLKFVDLDRNDTIDVRDRTFLGSPQPKFTFGFNNTFRYAGFELGIFMTGSYGNKVYNFIKQGQGTGLADMRSAWNNQLQEVTGRAQLQPIGEAVPEWYNDINNVRVSNPGTTIPRAIQNDPNQNTRTSDRYVEDGSYIRFRNISLAYTFPAALAGKLRLSGLRLYTNVQNAYTFTKYTGYDPEIGQDTLGSYVYGVDNGRYPSPRIYTLGLNIGL